MDLKGPLVKVAKYFAHGLMFSIVSFGLTFLWTFLLLFLVFTGALLGLILAFVLLAVGWGLVNTLITRVLWFPMRKGWKVYLGQGFLLFLAFFLVNFLPVYALIPLLLVMPVADQVLTVVVLTVLYAFGDGYLAKSIGGHWKVRGVQTEMMEKAAAMFKVAEIQVSNPDGAHCPRCGGVNLVVASDHSAYCLDCKRGLRHEVMGRPSG